MKKKKNNFEIKINEISSVNQRPHITFCLFSGKLRNIKKKTNKNPSSERDHRT